MTAVEYRLARAADLPALCALGHEVARSHHAACPDVFAPPGDPERDAHLRAEAIEDADGVAIVAERGTEILGFVTGAIVDEEVSLFRPVRICCVGVLGVAAAEQGRGLGRGLMNVLEQWAQSRSADEVHLDAWAFEPGRVAAVRRARLRHEDPAAGQAAGPGGRRSPGRPPRLIAAGDALGRPTRPEASSA